MASKIAGLGEGLGPIAIGGSPRTGLDTRPKSSRSFGQKLKATGEILYDMLGFDAVERLMTTPAETMMYSQDPDEVGAIGSDAMEAAGIAVMGSMPFPRPAGSVSMFIGPRAKLTKAMKEGLDDAARMAASGVDMPTIRKATGWDVGPSGQWRFEISDDAMKLTPFGETKAGTASRHTPDSAPEKLPKLGKQVDHPELYEMYPQLRDTPALIQHDPTGQGAFYPPRGNQSHAVEAYGPRSMRRGKSVEDVLAHELQHAVQYLEGQGHGANPDEIPSVVKRHYPHDGDFNRYLRNGAENEAKATQRRRTMTMGERQRMNPKYDMDFPPEGQWNWFDNGAILADDNKTVLRKASPANAGRGGRSLDAGKISGLGGDGRPIGIGHNKGPRMRPDLEKFPELENRYPTVKEGVWKVDKKTGKRYLGKDLSEEALRVDKVRKKIAEEVAKREYKPFFDPKKRQRVDPSNYPKDARTQDVTYPKKQATIDKYEALANDPESIARLEAGYAEANKFKDSGTWYYMKQLEDMFISEHGPEKGRAEFEQWARAMAETTGGADPQTNFLAAQYLLHRRGMGLEAPTAQPDMPYPVGGRFMSGNMEMANKQAGQPFDPAKNPKRHNFEANFEGHPDPTIDEVMMTQGFADPKGAPEYYGPYERVVGELAEKHGVPGDEFQDKAWQGLKRIAEMKRGDVPSIPGPMIQIINDSIERTARLIGKSPEYVARKMLVHRKPMYGISGMLLGAGALESMDGYEEPVI